MRRNFRIGHDIILTVKYALCYNAIKKCIMKVKIYSKTELDEKLQKGTLKNNLLISFYDPLYESCINHFDKVKKPITLPIPDIDIDSLEECGYTLD